MLWVPKVYLTTQKCRIRSNHVGTVWEIMEECFVLAQLTFLLCSSCPNCVKIMEANRMHIFLALWGIFADMDLVINISGISNF